MCAIDRFRLAIERTWTALALSTCLVLVVIIGAVSDSALIERTITQGLITLVAVIGLYIFIGNSGVTSFGHIAFMAIGAYASAWMTCCPEQKPSNFPGLPDFILHTQVPNLPAAILAGLFASLVALVIGSAIMRLSGLAASIGTFAFLAIVNVVYSNWNSVTMGMSSIIGLPTYVNIWVALLWALIALISANFFQISALGLSLRASRADCLRVECILRCYCGCVAGPLFGNIIGE
jgi:branched-chain amino acid transport system permease protein